MPNDWSLPTLTSLYTDVLSLLKGRGVASAIQDFAGDTNIPTGAIRYNRSTSKREEFNGTVWSTIQESLNLDKARAIFASNGGTANAQTITTNPTFTPAIGDVFFFFPVATNSSGSVTISINGSTPYSLFKSIYSVAVEGLSAGDLLEGRLSAIMIGGSSSAYLINPPTTNILKNDTAYFSINNSIVETEIFNATIFANVLQQKRSIKLRHIGRTYSNSNIGSSITATYKVKLGSTTLSTFTTSHLATSVQGEAIDINLLISAANASTQRFMGEIKEGKPSSASGTVADGYDKIAYLQGSGNEDMTSNKNLIITVQLGTAHAQMYYESLSTFSEFV